MTHDDPNAGPRGEESDIPPDTALWKKINDETDMLRRRTTPMHVQQRILSALPDPPPRNPGPAGRFKLSPTVAGVIGVTLLGLGLLLGMVLRTR